ncbi:MAG TPA: hypothetical protein VJ226_04365 [Bradyrhizobium sp.]|nr:hypothetical protein [Bradyrhizobium sp.]
MRASIAYFAGAGTVVAAIAVGLGGGLTIANIINPHLDKGIEVSRLERRMSSEPAARPSPSPTQAPYVATTQPATVSPAPAPAVASAPAAAPAQAETAKPAPSPSSSAEPSVATATIAKPQDPPAPQRAAAAPTPAAQPAREQVARPDDAMAKARDADVKRAERRSERRQQWADRRRRDPRQIEQRQGQELVDVEQKVREETEPPHEFAPGPRMDFPQIRLFGPD